MSDAFALDKRQVRRAFGRAAASYDAAAALQNEVARRLDEKLDMMRLDPARVCDLGCGTGYGTRLLARRYPKASLVALDLALPMLAITRRQGAGGGWLDRLTRKSPACLCADLERLPLAEGCADLLWSNLALQWSNDPDATFAGMRHALREGGLLLFSTFGPDTLKELRQAFASLDGAPHVSRFPDMHDLGDALVRAGFADPVMEMEMLTVTYSDLRTLLGDLKAIGAHNATMGRRRGMMGKGEWARLQAAYEGFRRDGRLPATYEVVYGHAWKAAPPVRRPPSEAPVRFFGQGGRP